MWIAVIIHTDSGSILRTIAAARAISPVNEERCLFGRSFHNIVAMSDYLTKYYSLYLSHFVVEASVVRQTPFKLLY